MMLVILHILRYTVLVNYRIGSLESFILQFLHVYFVNYRIGSLENFVFRLR